jgi:hypothetical protein
MGFQDMFWDEFIFYFNFVLSFNYMQLVYFFRPIDIIHIVKKGNYVRTLEEICIYSDTKHDH